jgi:predicted MFS family arabinose efflux permease
VVFWYTTSMVAQLGVRRCFHLVFLAFLVRMAYYALLPRLGTAWAVLPAELAHGFTFGLAWGAGTAHCAAIAPPGLEATTQGIFQGIYFGFGYGLGGLVGGRVYQRWGAQMVYVVACAVLSVGWAACTASQLALDRLQRVEERRMYAKVEVADIEMVEGRL